MARKGALVKFGLFWRLFEFNKIAFPGDLERLFYVQLSNLEQLVAQVAQVVAQIREWFAQSNSAGSTRYLAGRPGLEPG
jgi:hypothetical protein